MGAQRPPSHNSHVPSSAAWDEHWTDGSLGYGHQDSNMVSANLAHSHVLSFPFPIRVVVPPRGTPKPTVSEAIYSVQVAPANHVVTSSLQRNERELYDTLNEPWPAKVVLMASFYSHQMDTKLDETPYAKYMADVAADTRPSRDTVSKDDDDQQPLPDQVVATWAMRAAESPEALSKGVNLNRMDHVPTTPELAQSLADEMRDVPRSDSILPLQKRPRAVTVEDCTDNGVAREKSLPSSSSSVPSCTGALLTPTRLERASLTVTSGATVTRAPPPTVVARSECSGTPVPRQKDTENSYQTPRPRRRPSALDYLVSDSPAGTLQPAPEADCGSREMGDYHAAGSRIATVPSVTNAYQSMHAFSPTFGSPRKAQSIAPVSSMPLTRPQPSVFQQSNYGAEMAPMTGYQLIAAKLVGGLGGPPVLPIYRRFEALNHRLLLYMQADLADLEKELRALDAKDTIISSFRKLHNLSPPSLDEIQNYKSYLANGRLLAEEEAKFLDVADDLVLLARDEWMTGDVNADDGITPMPRNEEVVFPPTSSHAPESIVGNSVSSNPTLARGQDDLGTQLVQLGMAMFVALFVPITTFPIMPTFAGRMVVVMLVGTSVGIALMQSGLVQVLNRGTMDWIACAVIYGFSMAATASTFC
ncbi:hypothetical protein DCS_06787 [Drechmeria coniospora]|uniref:DUF6594 domain-containing protein n=1 Tax=Drechmeria coniospora TaxID=98403 RepID=A0A151GCJ1_DRECN|nr:hypothetical protein DCS_06787 [Drechmeria coniospora]KYK54826.1 hypothetical protein DCS_06787 [Drechmeria coniospora]